MSLTEAMFLAGGLLVQVKPRGATPFAPLLHMARGVACCPTRAAHYTALHRQVAQSVRVSWPGADASANSEYS